MMLRVRFRRDGIVEERVKPEAISALFGGGSITFLGGNGGPEETVVAGLDTDRILGLVRDVSISDIGFALNGLLSDMERTLIGVAEADLNLGILSAASVTFDCGLELTGSEASRRNGLLFTEAALLRALGGGIACRVTGLIDCCIITSELSFPWDLMNAR